ncbi:MAG: hypothetical protein ABSC08_09700 [Bryobacteraceae bacterium]
MGSFEIQVFVSLVVVLGAAFVALICDYLKGNNERLRERNEELQARAAEREMLETLLERFQARTFDAALKAQKEALRDLLANSAPAQRALSQSGVAALPEARAVGALPAVAGSPRRAVAKLGPEMGVAKDAPYPVIEWPVPVTETKGRYASPTETEEDAPAPRQPVEPDRGGFGRTTADEIGSRHAGRPSDQMAQDAVTARAGQRAATPAPAAPAASQPNVRVFQLPASPAVEAEPAQEAPAQTDHPSFPIDELPVPAGHFESQGLQDLLAAQGVFRGLVVFISVVANGDLAPLECPQFTRLLSSVSRTVLSLRREEDFSCRSAESEFVLIYPRETGPMAQRLIGRVKERLYDLQLRSLGAFSARFIWGAAESASDARLADLLRKARGQAHDFLKAQDAASGREAAAR